MVIDGSLTALKGFVVRDADVLEHVGVAGNRRCGERQEDDGEEKGGELVGCHGSRDALLGWS